MKKVAARTGRVDWNGEEVKPVEWLEGRGSHGPRGLKQPSARSQSLLRGESRLARAAWIETLNPNTYFNKGAVAARTGRVDWNKRLYEAKAFCEAVAARTGRVDWNKFVSAAGNPLAKEAMDYKWQMAIGMGAMLLSPASAVKTATQASGEQTQQTSQLSLASVNVSEAYTRAIVWMCQYMNIDAADADYGFEISTDFFDHSLDANMLRELTAMVLQGTMSKSDYRAALKKAEKIDPSKSAEETAEEIAADRVADIVMPNLEPDGAR